MLISDDYRKQLEQMHANKAQFGKNSSRWADPVWRLTAALETSDVLDYGCGKGELNLHLPFSVKCYDPGIAKHSANPEPADIVVCTDVLEHIEPDNLDQVLTHLRSKTKRRLLLNVNVKEAVKHLPDGRNAHLIVEPPDWWIAKLDADWFIEDGVVDLGYQIDEKGEPTDELLEFTVLLTPKEGT
tara:strand:- start:2052 stop:2606 length:555 start_codon:yes stop_codon:yes gene_type:complete